MPDRNWGEAVVTNRERIIATAQGKATDRKPLFFYFGPWGETIDRWRSEGKTIEDGPYGFARAFGLDEGIRTAPVTLGYMPKFDYVELEDRGDRLLIRDWLGIVQLIRKDGASIPHYIDYPVKSPEDWEKLKKERLQPDAPGRLDAEFDQWARSAQESGAAIQVGSWPYGLFGTLRDMLGVETLLMWFYDEPDTVSDMMSTLTDLWISVYEQVAQRVQIDILHIWEDMSGKTGSMISPKMVREFMCPNYRRIRDFADAHNIPIVGVDTDGDCSELIPLFMDAGINMLMPFEVQAGMDICKVAREFPELSIVGGFDKRTLWTGHEAIDREIERIMPMFDKGVRYFVAPDHLIPPEVSLDNFEYFLEKVRPLL